MADVNRALYLVLVTGMVTSTSLFVIGLAAYAVTSFRQYSELVLTVATVALLATPVTRTLVGAVTLAIDRERRSALVAGVVFLVLMLSVLLGFVLHFYP